jgi:7-cyano-7-deazaguanine reductase
LASVIAASSSRPATNAILDDLVKACQPRRMTVVGDFAVRGGMKTIVTASYDAVT